MDSITKEIVREYKQNLSVMTNEEFCKEWASVINNLKSIPPEKVSILKNTRKSSAGVSFGL